MMFTGTLSFVWFCITVLDYNISSNSEREQLSRESAMPLTPQRRRGPSRLQSSTYVLLRY